MSNNEYFNDSDYSSDEETDEPFNKRLIERYYYRHLIDALLNYTYIHPVQLKVIFDENLNYDEIISTIESWYKNYDPSSNGLEWAKSYGQAIGYINAIKSTGQDLWKMHIDENITAIKCNNSRGWNWDQRCVGGCSSEIRFLKDIEFVYEKKNENGITWKDLMECVMRVKCGKNDRYYEWFSECKVTKIDGNKLVFDLEFDHGS